MANLSLAIEDFRRARRQAAVQQVVARLTGQSPELLSYDEVRRQLRARHQRDVGLRDIPVDAIVGSVGRYADFTRGFLPRTDAMEQRWARVKAIATDVGWPPIEVYKIGDAYFVLDGHHRVSVARQLEMATIQAYVTEVDTRVPLSADPAPEELISKARYVEFQERTHLDTLRPGADLSVTEPGAYDLLEEHIAVHRHYVGLEQQREIGYEEAVMSWYDTVYRPVVAVIREKGLLHDFPGRTETDLYLWLSEHREELQEALGWDVSPESAATDLATSQSEQPQRVLARLGEKLLDAVEPDELEVGPGPGEWRAERFSSRRDDRLFLDLLVPISGEEAGWYGLEQALEVAQQEGSDVRGLHVVSAEAEADSAAVQALHDRFLWRCGEWHVDGHFVVEVGTVADKICERARWNDLVVLNLAHPPGEQPLDRLGSGFRSIVRHCPRPVLAVPRAATPLTRALLAYDGSPRAEEALFVATYLSGRWQIPLVVVTVTDEEEPATIAHARAYLEDHGVAATYVVPAGEPAQQILETAAAHDCDFLVMGGYGASPVVEVVLGSSLDKILRQTDKPVLICR